MLQGPNGASMRALCDKQIDLVQAYRSPDVVLFVVPSGVWNYFPWPCRYWANTRVVPSFLEI